MIRIRVTTAPRGATAGRMPTGHSLAPLADVPNGQRRDGGPELVIRRKDAVIPMPVLARRYEIGEPVEELKRSWVMQFLEGSSDLAIDDLPVNRFHLYHSHRLDGDTQHAIEATYLLS